MELALTATVVAPQHAIPIASLKDLSESQERIVKRDYKDSVPIYSLPGGNICVPSLSEESAADGPHTHVMDGKVNFNS